VAERRHDVLLVAPDVQPVPRLLNQNSLCMAVRGLDLSPATGLATFPPDLRDFTVSDARCGVLIRLSLRSLTDAGRFSRNQELEHERRTWFLCATTRKTGHG
jgi:hypothetical protein